MVGRNEIFVLAGVLAVLVVVGAVILIARSRSKTQGGRR